MLFPEPSFAAEWLEDGRDVVGLRRDWGSMRCIVKGWPLVASPLVGNDGAVIDTGEAVITVES